ncbi:MAG TPA: response regulator [Puia sp.]|nr:response regulator [Puia sp.]
MENSIKFSTAYPLNILIAEPFHDSGSSAHDVLIQLGYQPELAASSREMLKMTSQKFYDVVLMDIRMPEAEDILASFMTDSDGRRPIFIAMTMGGRNNFREIHLSEGMDHSIDKPVDRDELILQLKACSVLTGSRRIRATG